MRKILFTLTLLLSVVQVRADEGMWFLQLVKEQYLADSLRRAGLQLPYEALYDENKPSLRDVVGIFGAGCTGEVISRDGLVLTNNHCGFERVHAMSTLEKNYLQDGFFAKNRSEEVPVPDLSFKFVVGIEDVTEAILAFMQREKKTAAEVMDNYARNIAYQWGGESELSKRLGVEAELFSFYQGNRFYLIYTQEYTDVRLVVNPPQNVAQFGGNSDNWVWPRHNPDFAIFRIYADAQGNPADYDESNVPLHREHYLPISLGGVKEGDFSFIMGFPGRTQRYLTPGGLTYLQKSLYPCIAEMFKIRMNIFEKDMQANKEDNLKLAEEYFSLGNTSKNFEGQIAVIEREQLVKKAQERVAQLEAWAQQQGKSEYIGVAQTADSIYRVYADSVYDTRLFYGALQALYPFMRDKSGRYLNFLSGQIDSTKEEDLSEKGGYVRGYLTTNTTFSSVLGDKKAVEREKEIAKQLLIYYLKNRRLSINYLPHLHSVAAINAYVDKIYGQTIIKDSISLEKFWKKPTVKALQKDFFLQRFAKDIALFRQIAFIDDSLDIKKSHAERLFSKGLLEMYEGRKAPDANSSLRLTYGHVADLQSPKGSMYGYETTLDGLLAKENPRHPDYVVHPRLRELFDAKQFGRYARPDGKLPACFITTNDITGGNSGSPVLNARGELIGCAFDGNIEGLGGDLMYDKRLQRTIAVDIRFVLWVTEIFGGSRYVIDELDIRQ